jgi:hypothetical protein
LVLYQTFTWGEFIMDMFLHFYHLIFKAKYTNKNKLYQI